MGGALKDPEKGRFVCPIRSCGTHFHSKEEFDLRTLSCPKELVDYMAAITKTCDIKQAIGHIEGYRTEDGAPTFVQLKENAEAIHRAQKKARIAQRHDQVVNDEE